MTYQYSTTLELHRSSIDVTANYKVHAGFPARTNCLPEDSYPGEPDEIEDLRVSINCDDLKGMIDLDELADLFLAKVGAETLIENAKNYYV